MLWASACGLCFSLGDHTIALERREVLSHGIVGDTEPFRQGFDGKAFLILEKKVSNCCCRSPSKVIITFRAICTCPSFHINILTI